MALKIEIILPNTAATQKRILKLGSSLYDFKNAMEKIGKQTAAYYAGIGFASQGGVFGAKWPPLSKVTLAARGQNVELDSESDAKFVGFLINRRNQSNRSRRPRAGATGSTPLIETGRMMNSFTYKASAQQVVVGNSAPYFKYHQSSAPRKSQLPRRQMIGINTAIRSIVRDNLKAELQHKLEAA